MITSRQIRPENLNDVLAAPRRTIAAIMAIRAKQSNATVMTESRELVAQGEALLLRHTGLVRRIAYHLFRRRNYVDVEDLIEAGMVGLPEAMRARGHDTAGSFESLREYSHP